MAHLISCCFNHVPADTTNATTMTSDASVTTALPTLDPTSGGKGSITDILTSTIFLSVVAVLLAVILFLFVFVLVLSCCLCRVRYRCYRLRDLYSRFCLCCQQRNQGNECCELILILRLCCIGGRRGAGGRDYVLDMAWGVFIFLNFHFNMQWFIGSRWSHCH